MALSVEIIDFTRPVANSKNLYISGIVTELNEAQITSVLYEASCSFGLVYEVQVFRGGLFNVSRSTGGGNPRQGEGVASYYAFVKYFSYYAAQKAKSALSKQLKFGPQACKVNFATRHKETDAGLTLHAARCRELANFYLGFNGWTSSIKHLGPDATDATATQAVSTVTPHIRFFCVLELGFPRHGLTSQGVGAWEETYCQTDPSSRAVATVKCRKLSQQRALEDAFSRVLLVTLGNGKVTVELDTRRHDPHTHLAGTEQGIQVHELGGDEANAGSDGDMSLTGVDLDDANLQILQELESEALK